MADQALDANAAQRRYWNTVAGPRWVASPGFRERRNQESLALLLAHLNLTGGESVLEIGPGTGALTVPLAEAVGEHGRVVAVDISEPMLDAARQKVAERGLGNVTLHSGDAQVFAFEPAAFDLATSRMGVMFFADPAAAFRNIKSALKPGGRLAFACWAPNRREPALADFLRRRAATSRAAGTAPRARARPARLWRPRLYPSDPRGGRVCRDRGRARPSDNHLRQPRGGSPPGADDGTNGAADRSQKSRRGDAPGDRPRHRGGVCRRSPPPVRSGCRRRFFWSPRAARSSPPQRGQERPTAQSLLFVGRVDPVELA